MLGVTPFDDDDDDDDDVHDTSDVVGFHYQHHIRLFTISTKPMNQKLKKWCEGTH